MLDFRLETFLMLCKVKSYTKAAKLLHITQPAVTQHIKYLEEYYQGKLFLYTGRTLELTEKGKLLLSYVIPMKTSADKIREILHSDTGHGLTLNFGATRTIGEYVMPQLVSKLLEQIPQAHITMQVENTQMLLEWLIEGKIDFGFLEGYFDDPAFIAIPFSREPFIAIASSHSPLAGHPIAFSDLLSQRLLLREKGSGSRTICEQILFEHNLTVESFPQRLEFGNMNAIKHLVRQNKGITFFYEVAVKKSLTRGTIVSLDLEEFSLERDFQFVFLKNSVHEKEYLHWYRLFKQLQMG